MSMWKRRVPSRPGRGSMDRGSAQESATAGGAIAASIGGTSGAARLSRAPLSMLTDGTSAVTDASSPSQTPAAWHTNASLFKRSTLHPDRARAATMALRAPNDRGRRLESAVGIRGHYHGTEPREPWRGCAPGPRTRTRPRRRPPERAITVCSNERVTEGVAIREVARLCTRSMARRYLLPTLVGDCKHTCQHVPAVGRPHHSLVGSDLVERQPRRMGPARTSCVRRL